jgi:hypothetical protein
LVDSLLVGFLKKIYRTGKRPKGKEEQKERGTPRQKLR